MSNPPVVSSLGRSRRTVSSSSRNYLGCVRWGSRSRARVVSHRGTSQTWCRGTAADRGSRTWVSLHQWWISTLGCSHLLRDISTEMFVCLCWGLTSQSTIFQSCRDGATASWVINQYFRGVKCLAQGHNTAAVGFEPPTSRSGVRHSTTEPPRSPQLKCG